MTATATTQLTFDESIHQYKENGIVVPSVTQVLKESGLVDLSFVDKETLLYKSDLGTKVHKATEYFDRDVLDMEELHPVLKGYLNAWIKFSHDYKFIPQDIELRMIHPLYKYAGTIDRIGLIKPSIVQLDIKSGVRHHSHKIQSAGYTELYNYGKPKNEQVKRRFTVYLNEDGTYKVDEHKKATDFKIFLAALTITNYKRSL